MATPADSTDYRRKALCVLGSLEDHGVIPTRTEEKRDNDSPNSPPGIAMRSSSGESFVKEYAVELATIEMNYTELRQEVYRLRDGRELIEETFSERYRDLADCVDSWSATGWPRHKTVRRDAPACAVGESCVSSEVVECVGYLKF